MESPDIEKDPLFLQFEEILKKCDSSLEGLDFQLPSFQPPEASKNYFPEDLPSVQFNSPALHNRLEKVEDVIVSPHADNPATTQLPISEKERVGWSIKSFLEMLRYALTLRIKAAVRLHEGLTALQKILKMVFSWLRARPPVSHEIASGDSSPLIARQNDEHEQSRIKKMEDVEVLPETILIQVESKAESIVLKQKISRKLLPAFFYRAIFVVCIVAGGTYWIWGKFVPATGIVSLPFKDPTTLSLSGDRVFSLDSQGGYLYSMSRHSGKVLSRTPVSCAGALGLAVAQENLWCATIQGTVQRYVKGETGDYVLKRIYPMGADKLNSLYSDGEYLWGANSKNGKIYQYLISQSLTGTLLTPVNRFALSQVSPLGLYVSRRVLWVLDSSGGRIIRFKMATNGPKVLDSFDLNSALKNTGSLLSFTTDGKTLWILTQSPPEIHRLDLKDIRHPGNP